ncbi:9722_t:CDS:2, partial [Paraglomus occultum]
DMAYVDQLKDLISDKNFNAVQFYKNLNFPFARKKDAEEVLHESLKIITSENNVKARKLLANFDKLINANPVVSYWDGIYIQNEKNKTQFIKDALKEKDKQESYQIKLNVREEHIIESNLLLAEKRKSNEELLTPPNKVRICDTGYNSDSSEESYSSPEVAPRSLTNVFLELKDSCASGEVDDGTIFKSMNNNNGDDYILEPKDNHEQSNVEVQQKLISESVEGNHAEDQGSALQSRFPKNILDKNIERRVSNKKALKSITTFLEEVKADYQNAGPQLAAALDKFAGQKLARHLKHYFAHQKLPANSSIEEVVLRKFPSPACNERFPIQGVSGEFIQFRQTVNSLEPVYAEPAAEAFDQFTQERTEENLIKFLRQIAFRIIPKNPKSFAQKLLNLSEFDLPFSDIGSHPPSSLLQDYSDEVATYIQNALKRENQFSTQPLGTRVRAAVGYLFTQGSSKQTSKPSSTASTSSLEEGEILQDRTLPTPVETPEYTAVGEEVLNARRNAYQLAQAATSSRSLPEFTSRKQEKSRVLSDLDTENLADSGTLVVRDEDDETDKGVSGSGDL